MEDQFRIVRGLDQVQVTVVEVTASTRFTALRGEDNKQVDILCDPATVTRERLRDFTATIPLYLSGIGFAAQTRDNLAPVRSDCLPVIGVVANTTAFDTGLARILEGREWANYRKRLLRYLQYPSGWQAPAGCPPQPVVRYETHREAAQEFCAGMIQYYVGDLEIVNRALQMFGGCEFQPGSTTYSDDRYALLMRNPGPDEDSKARLLLGFSRILSEMVLIPPSLLDQAFDAAFAGYQPSEKLKLFFWSLHGR